MLHKAILPTDTQDENEYQEAVCICPHRVYRYKVAHYLLLSFVSASLTLTIVGAVLLNRNSEDMKLSSGILGTGLTFGLLAGLTLFGCTKAKSPVENDEESMLRADGREQTLSRS